MIFESDLIEMGINIWGINALKRNTYTMDRMAVDEMKVFYTHTKK